MISSSLQAITLIFSLAAVFGSDTRSGVAMLEHRYNPPFTFTGKIDKLTFQLTPEPKATPERSSPQGAK